MAATSARAADDFIGADFKLSINPIGASTVSKENEVSKKFAPRKQGLFVLGTSSRRRG